LKEKLKYFKQNLSIIVLIPTLLGGFWQLIALSNISVSYIRFFSITQLIADGILVLFLLTVIYSSFKFSTWVTNKGLQEKNSKGLKIFKFSFLFVCGIIWITVFIIDTIRTGYINTFLLFFSIVFGTMIIVLFFHLLVYFKIVQRLLKMEYLLVITSFIMLFGLMNFLDLTFSTFNKSFLIPQNLKNIEAFEKNLKTKYPNCSSISIKYFNDKYFFVEINQNDKSEIEIISFNKLIE
jgi:hypothetical protein